MLTALQVPKHQQKAGKSANFINENCVCTSVDGATVKILASKLFLVMEVTAPEIMTKYCRGLTFGDILLISTTKPNGQHVNLHSRRRITASYLTGQTHL